MSALRSHMYGMIIIERVVAFLAAVIEWTIEGEYDEEK